MTGATEVTATTTEGRSLCAHSSTGGNVSGPNGNSSPGTSTPPTTNYPPDAILTVAQTLWALYGRDELYGWASLTDTIQTAYLADTIGLFDTLTQAGYTITPT